MTVPVSETPRSAPDPLPGVAVPPVATEGTTRGVAALIGLGAAVAIGLLLILTESRLAVVWDEGSTMGREERIRTWWRALRDPAAFARTWKPVDPLADLVQRDGRAAPLPGQLDTRDKLWERATLEYFWPFAREEPHGHPTFYALLGLVGDLVAPNWPILARDRLGPMLFFAVVGGALATWLARRLGPWAALGGAGAWALQPRLFAHAHYAHYDAPLTSLWVAAILAFLLAVDRPEGASRWPRWGWALLFGVLAGCAAATKLTGWFLPLPFLVWALVARSPRGGLTLIVGGVVAVATLIALIPPWWANPVDGIERFLRSNLTRGRTTLIPTLFLGRVIYTPQDSLPWYNTLFWTVAVTPVGWIALTLLGFGREVGRARRQPLALLVPLNWLTLLVLRALPHTPGHDGERQFLAAFGILAILAGVGAGWVARRLGRWGRTLILLAVAEGAVSIAVMMPVPLSYYSPVVGGLPGAVRLGLEPTYYWDSLTDEPLDWLNTHTAPGERLVFMISPTMLNYLRSSGRLRPPCWFWEKGQPRWYVVQARLGFLADHDRILLQRVRPENVLVTKLGVPLLYVFPYDDLRRAFEEAKQAKEAREAQQAREAREARQGPRVNEVRSP